MSAWSPADYAAHAGFVPALGEAVLGLLVARAGERILDLGCGNGVLTERIGASGADVIGVDASPAMVDAARARGLDARVADGQALAFDGGFDAVFTNAALHWMPDQAAVAAGVFRALEPGGRYVGECGGFGNVAAIRAGIRAVLMARGLPLPDRDPQTYQTPAELAAHLEAAGFRDVDAQLIPRPTPLATGILGWLKTFRAGFLADMGVVPADEETIARDIESFLAPLLRDHLGNWTADYVRLRWTAHKPEL